MVYSRQCCNFGMQKINGYQVGEQIMKKISSKLIIFEYGHFKKIKKDMLTKFIEKQVKRFAIYLESIFIDREPSIFIIILSA